MTVECNKMSLERLHCVEIHVYIYIRFAHSAKHEWRWRVSNFFLNFWTWTLNIYSCCWWRFHVVHMFWVHVHNSQDFHCTVKSYMLYSMHWGGGGRGGREIDITPFVFYVKSIVEITEYWHIININIFYLKLLRIVLFYILLGQVMLGNDIFRCWSTDIWTKAVFQ